MLKHHRVTAAILALSMVFMLCSCGGSSTAVVASSAAPAPSVATAASAAPVKEADDAAALYELAKKEGKVVVYSVSSRIKTAVESFQTQYPGIVVESYDMRMPEILEKLERETAAGIKNADVILGNDNGGTMTFEMLPDGVITKYVPSDIYDKLDDTVKNAPLFEFTTELVSLFYNNEVYSESPIKSWWDLTKPEWKGKVMMPSPLNAPELLCLFGVFSQHADEMAADYKSTFGTDLVLSEGCPDAGYEFMKRLVENDVVIVDSQGGAVKAIGAEGQKDPSVCIVVSSKLRDRKNGLKIAIATELTPVVGMGNKNSLMMVANSEHPNAAKLLTRWIVGESDGKGKGYDGFNVLGGWSTRIDGASVNDVPLASLKYWDDDRDYMYKNGMALRDAWIALQK